jgi:hypothetical protein
MGNRHKELPIPEHIKKFYKHTYPHLDWTRVKLYDGLPSIPLAIRKETAAITLASWNSRNIDIYFRKDPLYTYKGIAMIGHELYHVQDVLSTNARFSFGLLHPWYFAYIICLLFSRFNSGESHCMEETPYSIERKIDEFFINPPNGIETKVGDKETEINLEIMPKEDILLV